MGDFQAENLNEEQIVLQGFRQTRERTNFQCRGSSMTATDAMDVDDLRRLSVYFQDAFTCMSAAFATIVVSMHSRMEAMQPFDRLKQVLDGLGLSVSWITCHLDMIFLSIEDKIQFAHEVERFKPHTNRKVEDIRNNNESYDLFGFKKNELELSLIHWRIPLVMREEGHVFTGEEATLVFLHYIRTAIPYTRMAKSTFGGDPRKFTFYIRAVLGHLCSNFYHKMTGDSMRQWLPYIDKFCEAILNKLLNGVINERRADGSECNWEVWFPFEEFRIFGWLDDTDMQTNRPRPGRTTQGNDITHERGTQTAFYNRYLRGHGLKAQVLLLPNGMIGSVFICSLRHNDNGVQNLSGLNDYLVSILSPLYSWDGSNVYPAVYGDDCFTTLATIVRPYQNPNDVQRIINVRFSSLRENIEHKFCQVFTSYPVLKASWRHHLFWEADDVRKLFFSCLFVANCYTCFNESRNRYFDMRAPTMQNFLPLHELHPPPSFVVGATLNPNNYH